MARIKEPLIERQKKQLERALLTLIQSHLDLPIRQLLDEYMQEAEERMGERLATTPMTYMKMIRLVTRKLHPSQDQFGHFVETLVREFMDIVDDCRLDLD